MVIIATVSDTEGIIVVPWTYIVATQQSKRLVTRERRNAGSAHRGLER